MKVKTFGVTGERQIEKPGEATKTGTTGEEGRTLEGKEQKTPGLRSDQKEDEETERLKGDRNRKNLRRKSRGEFVPSKSFKFGLG